MLVLRTCDRDLRSYNNFQWRDSGEVAAPDWNSRQECGYGLHGLAWGEGDGGLLNWDAGAKWLVVEVDETQIVDLAGKIKFPKCVVRYCGDRKGATQYLFEQGGAGKLVAGLDLIVGDNQAATVGYRGTATAGNYGTATAGNYGTATAGYRGTATAGYRGTATAGYRGTATAGEGGTATAGEGGTATAGYRGTATAGEGGTATAGYRGTATAGEGGTATAGEGGTATAGYRGTATAGEGGTLEIAWQQWLKDTYGYRTRKSIAYVGEAGILQNVAYKLNDKGLFVPVKPELILKPDAPVEVKPLAPDVVQTAIKPKAKRKPAAKRKAVKRKAKAKK